MRKGKKRHMGGAFEAAGRARASHAAGERKQKRSRNADASPSNPSTPNEPPLRRFINLMRRSGKR